MRTVIFAVALLALSVPIAGAQQARPDSEAGRNILKKVEDGFLRVERESGATSLCRQRDARWVCEAVADDRVALEEEVDRLVRENGELAREIGRLKERIARLEGGSVSRSDDEQPLFDVPTNKDVDRAMESFDKMMRRLLDTMKELREDYDQGTF